MTNSMFPSSLFLISMSQDHVIENEQSLKIEVKSSRQWWAQGLMGGSTGKESSCDAGDLGPIPELGSSPGEGIGYPLQYSWAFLVAQTVKNLPAMRDTWVQSLG